MEDNKKPDIFDRIMSVGLLKKLEPFYKAHKEVLLYLFFGVLTTVISWIFFAIPSSLLHLKDAVIFGQKLDMNSIVSNVISWIVAVAFAYVTNRIWVFQDRAYGVKGIAGECAKFFSGRLLTLVIETVLLNLCTTKLDMKEMTAKIIVSVITVILNYVISKLFVFNKKQTA
ncbi:MAG: GtrA family protein [Ruminococcus sp.]|nr:GtrA family protein [Ruminococcus sp.]